MEDPEIPTIPAVQEELSDYNAHLEELKGLVNNMDISKESEDSELIPIVATIEEEFKIDAKLPKDKLKLGSKKPKKDEASELLPQIEIENDRRVEVVLKKGQKPDIPNITTPDASFD